jgi:hypothetical protein
VSYYRLVNILKAANIKTSNIGVFMNLNNKKIIEEVIRSKNQLHLTMYVKGGTDIYFLKNQMANYLKKAKRELRNVLTESRIKEFLKPIIDLATDDEMLKKIKGNFGVFRKENYFRIISIPVEINSDYSLASTFYTKPLMKWIQQDNNYLIVGLSEDSISLIYGDLKQAKLVDEIQFKELFSNEDSEYIESEIEYYLNEWVAALKLDSRTKIFFVGNLSWKDRVVKNIKHPLKLKRILVNNFNKNLKVRYISEVRTLLKEETDLQIQNYINSFHALNFNEYLTTNIHEIAEAATNKKIKKLLIAEDFKIFGNYFAENGFIKINIKDKDHEDDDLLDDLAQEVIINGGEVVVTKFDTMNIKGPIAAIVEDTGLDFISA